jgi:outer membrane protein OmpA-like peptidoglycan-associated protein
MISFRRNTSATRADGGPSRGWARAEREADHVADSVLDRDTPIGHRPHAEVPQTGTTTVPGVGQPLDPARRAFFERRLGADLSTVRVHAGAAADRAAQDEHAHAYTFGEHVVMAGDADHTVLAHELVHVLQQRGAGRNAVQRQEKPRTGGIGRTRPKVDFDVVDKRPPGEDARVLFPHDSVTFNVADLKSLLQRLPANRPLDIDIDGYASTEGDADYNVNLSAHRAAVLQEVLRRLVPEARVRLHAHGATAAFGDPAANRRVGIRIAEAPVSLVPPLATPGRERDRHPRLLSGHLSLDPGLDTRVPPGTAPPSHDTATEESAPPPQLFPTQLTEPPSTGPVGPAQLFPWIVPPPRPVLDVGALHQVFTDHGIGGPIDPRLTDELNNFGMLWYQRFLESGLMTESRARWLVNITTRNMIGRVLTQQGNTPADLFSNDLSRSGLTEFIPTVDLLDLLREKRKNKP